MDINQYILHIYRDILHLLLFIGIFFIFIGIFFIPLVFGIFIINSVTVICYQMMTSRNWQKCGTKLTMEYN